MNRLLIPPDELLKMLECLDKIYTGCKINRSKRSRFILYAVLLNLYKTDAGVALEIAF